mgnify:CR=1 FL=1
MEKEQTKNQQEKNQKKSQKLQWHPAFCSALRLELLEDAENLEFTDEFQLTEKPLQIDCTVVKVKKDCKIKNEIGKIFRKHNIFEYKSPKDELNIDTFYKAVAYACLYKVLPNHVDEIQAEEITITLIRDRKPVKLMQELEKSGYECKKETVGIYYVSGVMFIIHRRWLLWSIIGISFGLLVLLVNVTKTGLIPEEDTGTVMVSMNTKPGTSMAQTSKVMERINSRLDSIGEIEYSGAVAGFSFSGSGPSQAMYFVTLKDWEQRKGEGQSVNDVIGKIYAATSDIPDATVFAMSPPMIAGYGMGNGFELYLQDKAGGELTA